MKMNMKLYCSSASGENLTTTVELDDKHRDDFDVFSNIVRVEMAHLVHKCGRDKASVAKRVVRGVDGKGKRYAIHDAMQLIGGPPWTTNSVRRVELRWVPEVLGQQQLSPVAHRLKAGWALRPASRFKVELVRLDRQDEIRTQLSGDLDNLITRRELVPYLKNLFGVEPAELYTSAGAPLDFNRVGSTQNGLQHALQGGALHFKAKCDVAATKSPTKRHKASRTILIDCGAAMPEKAKGFQLDTGGIGIDVMKALLDVFYTGKCEVESDGMLRELFSTSSRLELSVLTHKCVELITKRLELDNVVDAAILAERHGVIELRNAAIQWMTSNAKTLAGDGVAMKKLKEHPELFGCVFLAVVQGQL